MTKNLALGALGFIAAAAFAKAAAYAVAKIKEHNADA